MENRIALLTALSAWERPARNLVGFQRIDAERLKYHGRASLGQVSGAETMGVGGCGRNGCEDGATHGNETHEWVAV